VYKRFFLTFKPRRLKEASKGYFRDLNATRRHGGKTWIAPTVMIREDVCMSLKYYWGFLTSVVNTRNQKALYFPDIVGKSLATGEKLHTTDMCAGRISVISMLSTKISEVGSSEFFRVVPSSHLPMHSFIPKDLSNRRTVDFHPIRLINLSRSISKRTFSKQLSSPSSPRRSVLLSLDLSGLDI
jgi:ATPase complex subunit ATP10